MGTPHLYASGQRDPFQHVPDHLRNTAVEVVYVTDRERVDHDEEPIRYGYGRAVSSDLVLVLTGQLIPGPDRPLTPIEGGFWQIDDRYLLDRPAPTKSQGP